MAEKNTIETSLENLDLLASNQWIYDFGFNRTIEEAQAPNGQLRGYFKREKSHKSLWNLLFGSMSWKSEQAALQYYRLPTDTIRFIDWIFTELTGDDFATGERPEMDEMPYVKLYQIWHYIQYPEQHKNEEKPPKPYPKKMKQTNPPK